MLRSKPLALISSNGTSRTFAATLAVRVLAGPVGLGEDRDVVRGHTVLVLALGEPCRPVDEEHVALAVGRLLVAEDEQAGRDRRRVEEVRRQADRRRRAGPARGGTVGSGASAPPRNSTPWGITTPTRPVSGFIDDDHVLDEGIVAVLRWGHPQKARGSAAQRSAPQFVRENGGLAITTSNCGVAPSASLNAGARSVSPRAISKSSISCRNRFMRAMAAVVRLTSWPYNRSVRCRRRARAPVDRFDQHPAGAARRVVDGFAGLGVEDPRRAVDDLARA